MPIHPTALIGETPESREWIDKQMNRCGITPQIETRAVIGAYVTIDSGIERATTVGAHSFVMKACHLGHDVLVGEGCEIAPHTVLGGYAILRDRVKVGIGALILPYICIGEGAVVGAGAVVTRHVLAGETVAGNPARLLGESPADPKDRRNRSGPGKLRCGCYEYQVEKTGSATIVLPGTIWTGCPQHGEDPIC